MNPINCYSPITEIQQAINRGALRIDKLERMYHDQINSFNSELHAFITVLDPVGNEFNHRKPLSGIFIALKDIFETGGIPTTSGAEFLRKNVPLEDASVVKILKEAGALIIGKTNMHEIALGVTNINENYGICRNPWDKQRISGGSSGGSAVAVISGMCTAALGSDTGGSIRIPASLCGAVGLKPTYGRISLSGVFPLSWNLDHVGPLTRSVRDAAILLQVLAGYDETDPVSVDISVDDYISHLDEGIKNIKIVYAVGEYIDNADREVLAAVYNSEDVFKDMGAIVSKSDFSWLHEAALANGIITPADAAAVHQERIETAPGDFSDDVLKRLLIGKSYTSSEYARSRRVQDQVKRKFKNNFKDFDLLILPTTPVTAPLIEGVDAIEQAKRLTRFTAPFNISGLPAISIPCGFTKGGLPIGLQLVSDHWNEKELLAAAYAYETSTGWLDERSLPGFE